MGTIISWLSKRFLSKNRVRILMVGLDASGKTTILNKLKLGEIVATIPTIGFIVETVEFKNVNLSIWDVGGQQKVMNFEVNEGMQACKFLPISRIVQMLCMSMRLLINLGYMLLANDADTSRVLLPCLDFIKV